MLKISGLFVLSASIRAFDMEGTNDINIPGVEPGQYDEWYFKGERITAVVEIGNSVIPITDKNVYIDEYNPDHATMQEYLNDFIGKSFEKIWGVPG